MIATLKTLLTFVLGGAFLGLATASWLGPKWLEWDNTTRLAASTQTMCNLPEIVRLTASKLLRYQVTGTLVGAVIFLGLGIAFVVVRGRQQPRPPAAPPPRATPAA